MEASGGLRCVAASARRREPMSEKGDMGSSRYDSQVRAIKISSRRPVWALWRRCGGLRGRRWGRLGLSWNCPGGFSGHPGALFGRLGEMCVAPGQYLRNPILEDCWVILPPSPSFSVQSWSSAVAPPSCPSLLFPFSPSSVPSFRRRFLRARALSFFHVPVA